MLAPALREYPAYVYAGLAVIVGIYFLSAPTQNLRSFLTTLVIAGLAAFGIHELRRQAHRNTPTPATTRSSASTRDAMVGAVKSANLGERASKLRLPEVRRPEARERRRRTRRAAAPATTRTPASRASSGSPPCTRRASSDDEEFAAEKAGSATGGSWPRWTATAPIAPPSGARDGSDRGNLGAVLAARDLVARVCALSAAIGSGDQR